MLPDSCGSTNKLDAFYYIHIFKTRVRSSRNAFGKKSPMQTLIDRNASEAVTVSTKYINNPLGDCKDMIMTNCSPRACVGEVNYGSGLERSYFILKTPGCELLTYTPLTNGSFPISITSSIAGILHCEAGLCLQGQRGAPCRRRL